MRSIIVLFLIFIVNIGLKGQPLPSINTVKVNGELVSKDNGVIDWVTSDPSEGFTFSVNATNNGSESPAGYNFLTASFPELNTSGASTNVSEISGVTSGDLKITEFESGSVIAGQTIDYLFVEASDENGWIADESNTMTLGVQPSSYGNFVIYYRMQIGDGAGNYYKDPSNSSFMDASNEEVYRVTVRVKKPAVPQIIYGPTPFDYGSEDLGLSETNAFTIDNPGTGPLTVSASITGTDSDRFEIESGASLTVQPGGKEYITVRYKRDIEGSHSARVRLDHNASNLPSPQYISLAGETVFVGPPEPPLPSINTVKVNGELVSKDNGVIDWVTSDPSEGFTFSVNATNNGSESPAGYNFLTASFPELNTSGASTNVSEISGVTSGDLKITEFESGSVIAGQTIDYLFVEASDENGWIADESNTMTLGVQPSSYGNFVIYYRMQIGDGAGNYYKDPSNSSFMDASNEEVYRVTVRVKKPAVPQIIYGPTPFDYGSEDLGLSETNAFTIDNPGTGPLTVSASITGTDSDRFEIESGASLTVQPGGKEYITVRYKRDIEGSHSARVRLDHNASNLPSPQYISLEGETVSFSGDAVIVTVDGLDVGNTFKGILNVYTTLSFDVDGLLYDNYLGKALSEFDFQNHNIEQYDFEWNRNAEETELHLTRLRVFLREKYTRAQDLNAKFIVISHSWGTFLSYIALSKESVVLDPISPDLFITLSSPLGTYSAHPELSFYESVTSGYVNKWLAQLNFDDCTNCYPRTKKFINYWAIRDFISGPLDPIYGSINYPIDDYLVDALVSDEQIMEERGVVSQGWNNMKEWHANTGLVSTNSQSIKRSLEQEILAIINGINDPPKPDLDILSNVPSKIKLGETVDLDFSSLNIGGDSDYGSITISFPQLRTGNDKSNISIKNTTSDLSKVMVFERGDNTLNHREISDFSAEYLTVEFGDNYWQNQERQNLEVEFTPIRAGIYDIYVRSNFRDSESGNFNNSPLVSDYVDHQGWEVMKYTVEVFEESQKSILVLAPDGGESLSSGEPFNIGWSTQNLTGNVNIDLLNSSEETLAPIVTGTANDGSYSWTPDETYSGRDDLKIKITSSNDASVSDVSDGVFSIVQVDSPILSFNTELIDFQNVTIGSSRIISYRMAGSNLNSDINIVAPDGFEVALGSENIIYGKELTIPVNGGSSSEIILVRFTPTVEGPYDAQIEHTTAGISPEYVSVTGNGVTGAVISLSASELKFPDVDVSDGDSTVLSYQLLGSGLSSPITINASEIFSVSLSENSGFQTSLSIAQDNGSVEDSIYVRFKPSTLTQYSEELEHTALNADTKTIAVKGNAVVIPDPYLVLPDSPLDFGDVELSKDSVISYNVVGAYLRDSLYVDPSEGFQVSLKPDSDFLDQLSIAHVPDSTIIQRRIYVRFTPSSVQAYDGSINHTTEDVPDEIVSLMGSGVVPSTIEVWPGDANNDGIVSSADILPIGLHYDKNRPGENNPGSEWQMYQRDPWSIDGSVPNAIYADANGDGVVNTREVLTIGLNYGKTHTLSKSVSEKSEFLTSVGVLQIEPEVLSEGVLGMSLRTDSQEDLFGISMKVKVESLSGRGQITNYELDIENSLFGNNLISFDKAMKDGKTFDIAISKKEASTESYHGEIYSLSMNHDFSSTDELLISVEDIVVTNKDGELYKIESEPVSFSLGKFDGQDFNDKPKKFSINQNYPNPFNPTTVISFSLPVESEVELSVFSMSGQKVAELVSGRMASGNHKVVFNASNLSSGVYVYRIKAGSFVQTKKLTLIK